MTETLAVEAVVLHAVWSGGSLHVWCERGGDVPGSGESPNVVQWHPFAGDPEALSREIPALVPIASSGVAGVVTLRLPSIHGRPLPSPRLALSMGRETEVDEGQAAVLAPFEVRTISIPTARVLASLDWLGGLAEEGRAGPVVVAGSVEFFVETGAFVRSLLAQQRFVPLLRQSTTGELTGVWYPWLSDEANARRVATLMSAMPASARAVVDRASHDAWTMLEDFLSTLTDAECRRILIGNDFADSISGRDAAQDAHVAWLSGLLRESPAVLATPAARQDLSKRVRGWVGLLEDRGTGSAWRLLLRLSEPVESLTAKASEDPQWTVSFHLQSVDRPGILLDAEDIWLLPGDFVTVQGTRVDGPQELILAELGRASRLYKRLEEALEEATPTKQTLSTRQAYEFLREVRPILLEQGFGIQAPEWWDSPMARLGARLRLDADQSTDPAINPGAGISNAAGAQIGLGALVKYRWEIAVGDAALSLHEFEQLAAKRTPLVRINGRWVEIRPEDVQAAVKFIRENPGGEMKVGEALRLAFGTDARETGIPVVGIEGGGWLNAFLSAEVSNRQTEVVETPPGFHGTLRPYQLRGISWMWFMERLGFGLCLADDMGLGKTIQLLALMALERERALAAAGLPGFDSVEAPRAPGVGPTLLLVPMSVVGNWIAETKRFCPRLRVLVHHGTERLLGDALKAGALESDLVITTYALAHRDRDVLAAVPWHRLVLDEAQYIKNPAAKQSQAVRSIPAERRVALTGTPVENRLTELWSIMDFLNPGYLGTSGSFRQRFGLAVERFHDRARSDQLRGLIRPFILRRLKTDPNVVSDLPEKVETRELAHLTSEQASLYESCVRKMLAEVDEAEGIQRRGLVLSALVKLKQICNHPTQLLRDIPEGSSKLPDPGRSGKCIRLLEMLDEIVAEGDKALIFTQFREMGSLLAPMIRHQLGREVLFLHGGTTQTQRQQIIDTFQKEGSSVPVLILSLKAGGVGLNLTAATHVFHFDRWWNPAVENQATDRAYRIGQTRTVQVHKFVIRGTLEERIDQMIESKIALAENIIGSGEQWLTELNTDQLREVLSLRNDTVDEV